MEFTIEGGSIQAINTFLTQISSQPWPQQWKLHPALVQFNDAKDKERKGVICFNQLKETLTEEQAQAEVDDFLKADTISSGLRSLKQSGSILVLSGYADKDLQHKEKPKDHVVLLFLKNRTLYIYDPDWSPSPPNHQARFGDLSGQARAVQVYKAMKGKFQVDNIKTGGGGNENGVDCVPMCLEILQRMMAGDEEALALQWAVETIKNKVS
ncbi:hypothetical protein V496_00802 [Pseudogymnoascus sp. VKM F-4515 (FW-2607)]|nr:hypothetical protein V496_00802 [Pseudogymnoascus sp. VKM F-4515 (FW-2607)]